MGLRYMYMYMYDCMPRVMRGKDIYNTHDRFDACSFVYFHILVSWGTLVSGV